jgi:SRSO17 transposase
VRDALRRYVCESLGDPQAVLIVAETGFLKKGTTSAGVARQYSGTAGTIDTGQMGVFLGYASPTGRTGLDREWYLPQAWLTDPERCQGAGMPATITCQTTPQLAHALLERALAAGVPAKWVTGDAVYGHDRQWRVWLESWPQAYVMAVPANEPVWQGVQPLRVQGLSARLAANAWQRLSAGDGAKGPRLYDWAVIPVNPPLTPGWCRWVLARRSLETPTDLADDVVCAPESTPLVEMVRAAGSRWSIAECIEATTGEVGLDQYEVRLWSAWYRHLTLALFAHAVRTVIRAHAQREAQDKGGPRHRRARLHRRPLPRPLTRAYRSRCRKCGGYDGRSH